MEISPDKQEVSAASLKREAMRLMSIGKEWRKKRSPGMQPAKKKLLKDSKIEENRRMQKGTAGDTAPSKPRKVPFSRIRKWQGDLNEKSFNEKTRGGPDRREECESDSLDPSGQTYIDLNMCDCAENVARNPIKDFVDLTITPDPPFISSGPAAIRDNNVKALKDSLRMERFKPVFVRCRDPYKEVLSIDEQQIVKILTVKSKPDTELLYYRNIRGWVYVNLLNGSHFRVLRPCGWLTDEIVNAYTTLLNKRNNEIIESCDAFSAEGIPNTHVFSSFYFERMKGRRKGQLDYPPVKRWTRKETLDIFSFDLLLFPINIRNRHWVLVAIDMRREMLLYLDSLHGKDSLGVLTTLSRWLLEETKDKKGIEKVKSLEVARWECILNKVPVLSKNCLPSIFKGLGVENGDFARVPIQNDSSSCGVFLTKTAECLSVGKPLFFTQEDMPHLRNRVIIDLYRSFIPI